MCLQSKLVIPVLLLMGILSPLHAEDWPHLRGPDYDGHLKVLEEPISEPGGRRLPVLWETHLGQGFSGVIAAKETLYTQFQTRAGQFITALDARTGAVKWKTRYNWPYEPDGQWPGPYATPTFSKRRVYFTGSYGTVGCVNAEDGKLVWSRDLKKDFKTQGMGFGFACTPLVINDKVYVHAGGPGACLVALNAETGATIWQSGDDAPSYCSPIPVIIEEKTQIVSFLQNAIIAYAPETGQELWRIPWPVEGYDEHAAWLLYQTPYLFASAPFREGAWVFDLSKAADTGKPERIWQSERMSNDVLSSIIVGDYVYGFDIHDLQARQTGTAGAFKCLGLKTGREYWATDKTGPVSVLALPEMLVLWSETGTLIFAEPAYLEYRELFKQEIIEAEQCWTQPTYYKGRLFLRGAQSIFCIGLNAGAVLGIETETESPKPAFHWLFGYIDAAANELVCSRLWLWFLLGLVGSIYIPWAARLPMIDRNGWRFWLCAVLASFGIGLLGSLVLKGFVFLFPAILHILMIWLCTRAVDKESGKGLTKRLWLAGFIIFTIIYYLICRNAFVTIGFGFLIGLLPAMPLAWLAAFEIVKGRQKKAIFLWMPLSFTLYFWSSVAIMAIKGF